MADNLERTDLTGILHMSTDAGTCIIIPYPNDSESLRSVLWKLTKINNSCSLFTIHEVDSDIMILRDFLVDLCFYLSHLLCSRLRIEDIVAFGLFLLHVCIP